MLILLGVGLVVAGLLVWTGALSWFGRLPGDIRWEGQRGRVYIPVVSMLLVSLVLSVLAWVFRQLELPAPETFIPLGMTTTPSGVTWNRRRSSASS